MNDSSHDGPGAEKMPLVPLHHQSPKLDRRERAKALSQLSLQSIASDVIDVPDAGEDEDEAVGMATLFDYKP